MRRRKVAVFTVDNFGTIGRVRRLHFLPAFCTCPLPHLSRIAQSYALAVALLGALGWNREVHIPIEAKLLWKNLKGYLQYLAGKSLIANGILDIIDVVRNIHRQWWALTPLFVPFPSLCPNLLFTHWKVIVRLTLVVAERCEFHRKELTPFRRFPHMFNDLGHQRLILFFCVLLVENAVLSMSQTTAAKKMMCICTLCHVEAIAQPFPCEEAETDHGTSSNNRLTFVEV